MLNPTGARIGAYARGLGALGCRTDLEEPVSGLPDLPRRPPKPRFDLERGGPRIREIIDGQIIPHLERRQARQDCPRLHLRSVTARLDIRAAADDDQAPERVATHPLELALKPFALGPATRHEVVNDLALDGRGMLGA